MEEQEKEYLTEGEASAFLGVSRASLANYVKQKKLKKYIQEAPRQILYKRSELQALKTIKPKD